MKVRYEDGVIDHTVLLKKRITDEVVYLVGKAQMDNIFVANFENPTEEDYKILGRAACDILAHEIWAVDELEYACSDCVDLYAEEICERFRQSHKVSDKCDPLRIGDIVHTAAYFVAYCSSEIQHDLDEAIYQKMQEIERNGRSEDGMVSIVGP